MDIVVYVLLAVIVLLGAALMTLMLRRNDAGGQIVLADTVQRIQESLRDQERALAGRYDVSAVPTLMLFNQGRAELLSQGAMGAADLRARLSRYLASPAGPPAAPVAR